MPRKLKITVDLNICVGNAMCETFATNTFALNEDRQSTVTNPDGDSEEQVIGHNARYAAHCDRASTALMELPETLRRPVPPEYNDPYVVAAYMVSYHLSHCVLAYWAFKRLFGCVAVPDALYICDVGAGAGAARVGLALALSELHKSPTVYFDAIEPSKVMLSAGDLFWQHLQDDGDNVSKFAYREYAKTPTGLPDIPDGTLRLVTAFHLSLPYDGSWDVVGMSAKRSVESAFRLVSPHAGLFTCHPNKGDAMGRIVDGLSSWIVSHSSTSGIPDDSNGVESISTFYTNCVVNLGFEVSDRISVRYWSRYRFSLPKGILRMEASEPRREIDSRHQTTPRTQPRKPNVAVERRQPITATSSGNRPTTSGTSRTQPNTPRDPKVELSPARESGRIYAGDRVRITGFGEGTVRKIRKNRVNVLLDRGWPWEGQISELKLL